MVLRTVQKCDGLLDTYQLTIPINQSNLIQLEKDNLSVYTMLVPKTGYVQVNVRKHDTFIIWHAIAKWNINSEI